MVWKQEKSGKIHARHPQMDNILFLFVNVFCLEAGVKI